MLKHAVPNYKNSHHLVMTLRISLYHNRTLGEQIKKWKWERVLLRRELAKIMGVKKIMILKWERGRLNQSKKDLRGLEVFQEITHQLLCNGDSQWPEKKIDHQKIKTIIKNFKRLNFLEVQC